MSAKIEYNGNVVATVDINKTATLPVKDLKMATHIKVIADPIPTETWVLTLEDGSTVTKEVSVTYTSGGTIKTFTIDGESFEFEEGMSWYQWAGSNYAPDSYTCASTDSRVKPTGDTYIVDRDGEEVLGRELIHAGDAYSIEEDA